MRKVLFVPLSLLLVLWCASAWSAQTAPLRAQIKEASTHDNAEGITTLLGVLMQCADGADQQRRNPIALREWEELCSNCQDALAKLTSFEAEKALLNMFPKIPPNMQPVVVLSLKTHRPNPDLDAMLLKWLAQTRMYQVQVACMDVLGQHKVREAVEPISKYLELKQPLCLQVSACRALARIQDVLAIPKLIELLGQYKTGRMKYELTNALRNITGQKLDPEKQAWENWYKEASKNPKGVQVNPPLDVEFNYDLSSEMAEQLSYYGIKVIENRIVFVFDASGSMSLGGKPNRLDAARTDLKKIIGELRPDTLFNVVVFSNNVRRWQKESPLVPATPANKKAAEQFLDEARPGGSTQTVAALEEALQEISLINGVETIYLMTDGAPDPMNHSLIMNPPKAGGNPDFPMYNKAILRRIQFLNEIMKVRINTIGVYTTAPGDPNLHEGVETMADFLKKLAAQNDGAYKEVK